MASRGHLTHIAVLRENFRVSVLAPLYPNDHREWRGLMGWGSGRKMILLRFALRPRSGARLRARDCLRSGSLVTSLSFMRCSARLAPGGLFFRFPKYRQNKHRCNDRASMQRMRLQVASNSLRARHGAVLCKPRTTGASTQMQTKTERQCEHMKCTICPFQRVAENFVICDEIEADIPDMHVKALGEAFDACFRKHRSRHAVLDVLCSVDLTLQA